MKCIKQLSKSNNWIAFVRGNHDNPAYFNQQPIKHRRWMTLPDYSVVKACGHTILCVGGATSIDRMWRMTLRQFHLQQPDEPLIPNVYWIDEGPTYDGLKLETINELYTIDAVITHTSPCNNTFFPGTTIVSTHNLGYLGVSEKTGVVARSNFLL